MATPVDRVFAALKTAKGPGDVIKAISQDTTLAVGLVIILAVILLFLRIYLWPHINPFQFRWFSDFWTWLTSPAAEVEKRREYPFAKVIYPTYR